MKNNGDTAVEMATNIIVIILSNILLFIYLLVAMVFISLIFFSNIFAIISIIIYYL